MFVNRFKCVVRDILLPDKQKGLITYIIEQFKVI